MLFDDSQPRSNTCMESGNGAGNSAGSSGIASSAEIKHGVAVGQLGPHGALEIIVGLAPGNDFIERAQAALAQAAVAVHLAQADARRWHGRGQNRKQRGRSIDHQARASVKVSIHYAAKWFSKAL